MAIIVVGDKPLEQWQEFVVESLEKVEKDEVEAVGVFLLLKGGGMAKGYLDLTVDRMREIAKELQDDIVQGLAEMALQEMIDGEGKEE